MAEVVVDVSAMVDVLLGGPLGEAVGRRLSGHALHGPAHLDAECLSALGRLSRAGHVPPATVERQLDLLAAAPIERHPVAGLLRERGPAEAISDWPTRSTSSWPSRWDCRSSRRTVG